MSSPSSRERLGLLLGFVGMAIFGGTLPATRIAVAEIDPIALTSLRTAIAGLCSLVLLLVLRRKLPPRALWPQLVIAMLCVAILFPLLMSLGMQRVPTRRMAAWCWACCRSPPRSSRLPLPMSGLGRCSGSLPSPAPRW
jgi:drug/metabolite transporter (DMT)-like permease